MRILLITTNIHGNLSERLRPQNFNEVEGHPQLLSEGGFLKKILLSKKPLSILLWGPPGSGKTSIARLYAQSFNKPYHYIHPQEHSLADIKKVIQEQERSPLLHQKPALIFVDEIHRFNKAQQDIFLPLIENGSVVLIGATTEHPSYSINQALISRLRVLKIESLQFADLEKIFSRFQKLYPLVHFSEEAKKNLILSSQGDARHLINLLENVLSCQETSIDTNSLEFLLQKKIPLYDNNKELHYQLISALHKSIRTSDPQAALYYLARMLQGGEDPRYILRRLVRIASEDIGLADPQALNCALDAFKAYEILGSPEGDLAIAQCCVYLALSPKSCSIYKGYEKAKGAAAQTSMLPPPLYGLNASTTLEKELGYGKGYCYDHDTKEKCSGLDFLPHDLKERDFYKPNRIGFERELYKRMEYFDKFRK